MKKLCTAICLITVLVLGLFPMSALAATTPTPYGLTASTMTTDETHPGGSALLSFNIDGLPGDTGNTSLTWYVCIDKKIGTGDWITVEQIPSARMLSEHQAGANAYQFEQLWVENYEWDGVARISYRVYVILDDLVGNSGLKSGYSNTAALGLQSSAWAAPELKQAESFGLIPDILKGKDLTKPITREEFCELAVLLYEKVTATAATKASPNPFTDTSNPQILKAYQLGITKGISDTTFEPNTLINREQCAAMLYRAIRAIAPDGDYSVVGVNDFPDQKQISSWAVESTKYMSKIGIIKGDAGGNFMPKATSSARHAAGYGMATREAAILMTVRAYDKISQQL
ncbi:hypothetical protein MASR2M70_11630 [Bacillota bacterium]